MHLFHSSLKLNNKENSSFITESPEVGQASGSFCSLILPSSVSVLSSGWWLQLPQPFQTLPPKGQASSSLRAEGLFPDVPQNTSTPVSLTRVRSYVHAWVNLCLEDLLTKYVGCENSLCKFVYMRLG
ncbi:hypothetical protein H1C71_023779 [Ictidomys tridecemlineatus]|nr:hypothetical protein H1C71_023779 [Ictidomys tridecemlineatus]